MHILDFTNSTDGAGSKVFLDEHAESVCHSYQLLLPADGLRHYGKGTGEVFMVAKATQGCYRIQHEVVLHEFDCHESTKGTVLL